MNYEHHEKPVTIKLKEDEQDSSELVQEKEEQAKKPSGPPAAKSLLSTKDKNQENFDKASQLVDVPIDEVRAITLKVAPTWKLDNVQSVTLKSFRKIIGYDTFNSILKGDRNEKKDHADYYNVTVSMMIKRSPEEKASAPARDPYAGGKSLAETLDKGFPYDDNDSYNDATAPSFHSQSLVQQSLVVGKLNGENVTK